MAEGVARLYLGPMDMLLAVYNAGVGGGVGPFDRMLKRWGVLYLIDMKGRFVKASQSPGNPWADLAESTKKKRAAEHVQRRGWRRYVKGGGVVYAQAKSSYKGRRFAILRDTGTLFKALTPGSPGNLFMRTLGGIRVGFGGPARYVKGKSRASIADIASFHNTGDGVPERVILTIPSTRTQAAMVTELRKAWQSACAQASSGGHL